jgi:hypothetical protein
MPTMAAAPVQAFVLPAALAAGTTAAAVAMHEETGDRD